MAVLQRMSGIKLTYFNGRGRAETARYVLAYAGAEYEDNRITGEQFAELKPSLNYGQLPVKHESGYICFKGSPVQWQVLEYEGTTLCQSVTIARFLATTFNLAGRTALERAMVDEVADAVTDVQNAVVGISLHLQAVNQAFIKKSFVSTAPSSKKTRL